MGGKDEDLLVPSMNVVDTNNQLIKIQTTS